MISPSGSSTEQTPGTVTEAQDSPRAAEPGQEAVATSAPPRWRWLALLFAGLCGLGVAISAELTRIHVFVHTDPSYHSVCALSEGVNCETVAVSPYSVFAGLPVSVWGVLGYLLMGLLASWGWSEQRLRPTWPLGILLSLTAFSVLASGVLAFISMTRIDSLCLFCMGSYAINLGLLAIGLAVRKQSAISPMRLLLADLQALAGRPLLAMLLLVAGAATLVALQLCVPSYWRTPGWSDLPRLATGVDEAGHRWIGASSPQLTIVEFSDYECPHCRAAHKAIRLLAAKRPDQVRLVHRHLPLDQACNHALRRPFHARACLFAEAAECAGLQGAFWEMNDALFSIQETVRTAEVVPEELAVRLGLNRSEFKTCLESHAMAGRIAADLREAAARKLRGTPSFLVGERLFLGRIEGGQLEQLLRDAAARPEEPGDRPEREPGPGGAPR